MLGEEQNENGNLVTGMVSGFCSADGTSKVLKNV